MISDRQVAAATFDYHLSLSFFHYYNKKLKVNKKNEKRHWLPIKGEEEDKEGGGRQKQKKNFFSFLV